MNKSAIQKFAMWARNELIAQVSQRAYQYGIEEDNIQNGLAETLGGRILSPEERIQRQELIQQIREKGYRQVMEEVAYTWFNRFIALRFMEVNNYLPSHIRVFSDASGAFKPEILNDVLHVDLPGLDLEKVETYVENNDTEALYRYLLLVQCNALNKPLPAMFERMGSYTEMLLPNNILHQESVIGHMVLDIPEEDWLDQVQIIGWLYQYYNTELKNDTFADLKKNIKITKERIPAATQLFTPDWIVRYMVENSLGRLWLEGHPNVELRNNWKYYLDEAEQEPEVEMQLAKIREDYKCIRPEEITLIDPCMGSGHILVYAFDVLIQIYSAAGWNPRDAAVNIINNNLYGLDIDDRAAQLAYFAVMMKARQYDRRLFSREIQPNIYAIHESDSIQNEVVEYFHKNDEKLKKAIESIISEMRDAKEYGSILNVTSVDFEGLYVRFEEIKDDIHMMQKEALEELLPLVKCAEILSRKYDVVVTNPPYMGISGMGEKLANYVKKTCPDGKSDLFAVFIERCRDMIEENGYQAMITQHAWMFLFSFEKLRVKILGIEIVNMAHLGARAFDEIGGEVVQTTCFVLRKMSARKYKGVYCRLIEPTSEKSKEDMFLARANRYFAKQEDFSKIPGTPVAYWLSTKLIEDFSTNTVLKLNGDTRQGMATSDNNRFLRLWMEVSNGRLGLGCASAEEALKVHKKWYPYNKGGEYRKWYGNIDYVINYENDGEEVKAYASSLYKVATRTIKSISEYFKPCLSWSKISSGTIAFRYYPKGFIFDVAGCCIFYKNKNLMDYHFGFINSKVARCFLEAISPTLNYEAGHIASLPIIEKASEQLNIGVLVTKNIDMSKDDWDAYEISWDFKRNPLI